ncbi:four helix bundle protein [Geobacter sp.]|uniref:four helix bundle protein n=1 Tax=Geobacter sp. TaxID=46610 RepID=UPI002606427C|nr:four helix bundle protein [Geobacter sp.]
MGDGGVTCYRDLEVWRLGVDLVEMVYQISRSFPPSESFGLTSQVQRAAVSVPANIAEGHARKSSREFLQFISIALGSLAEVETHLHIAQRLKYAVPTELETITETADKLGRKLRNLQRSLKEKTRN